MIRGDGELPEPGDFLLDRTYEAHQTVREVLHSDIPPLTPQTTESALARMVTLVSYTAQMVGRVGPALRRGADGLDLYLANPGVETYGTADEAVAGALGHMALARDDLERAVIQLQAAESRLTWVGYHTDGEAESD